MLQLPPLVISSVDNTRLRRLLDNPVFRDSDGAEALEDELERAEVVEPAELPPNVVSMNSTARLQEINTGREFELKLVYPEQSGSAGRVSVLAPLGSALLGMAAGREIEWPLPSGQTARIRVIEVTYQPEAAGEELS